MIREEEYMNAEYVHVYDSVPRRWPAYADFILGYVDGHWPQVREVQAEFPNAHIIQCTTTGQSGVRLADIERGNFTTISPVEWARTEIRNHRKPWLYGSSATLADITARLGYYGYDATDYDLWLAEWDGRAVIPATYQAHQYASSLLYDTSIALLSAVLWRP